MNEQEREGGPIRRVMDFLWLVLLILGEGEREGGRGRMGGERRGEGEGREGQGVGRWERMEEGKTRRSCLLRPFR